LIFKNAEAQEMALFKSGEKGITIKN